jgi:hypothetical protein
MAGPGETLGRPWPPLAISPCKAASGVEGPSLGIRNDENRRNDENLTIHQFGRYVVILIAKTRIVLTLPPQGSHMLYVLWGAVPQPTCQVARAKSKLAMTFVIPTIDVVLDPSDCRVV